MLPCLDGVGAKSLRISPDSSEMTRAGELGAPGTPRLMNILGQFVIARSRGSCRSRVHFSAPGLNSDWETPDYMRHLAGGLTWPEQWSGRMS
jgi:hypothetical protein